MKQLLLFALLSLILTQCSEARGHFAPSSGSRMSRTDDQQPAGPQPVIIPPNPSTTQAPNGQEQQPANGQGGKGCL